MADIFPDIKLPNKRKRTFYKYQIRTEFEAGYVQSRPKGTKGRWIYELSWDNLSIDDFNTLQNHFDDNCGETFTVSKDILLTTNNLICRYAEDNISAETSIPGFYSTSVQLEEA